jgi:hypothetical protein
MPEYDYRIDGPASYRLACEAMRGHAYVRMGEDGPELVCHRHNINGHQEFVVPMTRNMLLILMGHISDALLRMK